MKQAKDESNFDFEYVQTDVQLNNLTSQLKDVSTVALDTEADSFHHYSPKVCLIQLSFSEKTFIVDPLADLNLTALLAQLAHKELIIHDAGYDLRMLKADFGFKPKNGVFDTMLAAALTGKPNIGLAFLLEQVLGMKVAKHNQRADWSKRPLPDHLLQYAAEDTSYLMQIKQHLHEELDRLGRIQWHAESCIQAIKTAYAEKRFCDPDNEWRIKGSGLLSSKELAFVRELWYWREAIAEKTNIAPFMICRNSEIIKLAQWASKRKSSIEKNSRLPIRCRKSDRKAVINALQEAEKLPEEKWPGPRKSDPTKRLSQTTRNTVNELKAECESIATDLGMDLQWIAPRAALTQIVLNNTTTLQEIQNNNILLNWQATLILPAVQKVLI